MYINTKKSRIEADDKTALRTDAWMITFSDVIMLLTTFFVMLLTMSSINHKSLKDTLNYLKESIGGPAYSGYKGKATPENIKEALKNIEREISIKEDERGIVLSINEDILFESGKYSIKKENYRILDSIADAIGYCSNDIMVMGHTDDLSMQTGNYESNWELSVYRGLCVLDYFIKNKQLPPNRFHVGGYGSLRPLFPNNSPKHRALNRRVEIIFKNKEV